jgi:hypothetical protein
MLLQSALEVALSVIRANPAVLEGLGAYLEGNLPSYLDDPTLQSSPLCHLICLIR